MEGRMEYISISLLLCASDSVHNLDNAFSDINYRSQVPYLVSATSL